MSASPTSAGLLLAGPGRLPGLDHLRALAIGLVLGFHYRLFPHPGWLTSLAKFGWTGVDLFFVLSGYLITAPLLAEAARRGRVSAGRFFLKRAFRILPPYLLVLGLYFLVPGFREREALPPLWKFLTFTQNFGLDLGQRGTFSHAWSLCVEEQFYLVLPLVVAAGAPMRRPGRLAWLLPLLLGLGLLLRGAGWHYLVAPHAAASEAGLRWYEWVYYPTYNRLDGLLVGIGLAALLQFSPGLAARLLGWGNWLVAGGLLVLAGAGLLCQHEQSLAASVAGFPVVALGYGLLVAGALSPRCWLHRWQSALTARLAAFSYGLYLLHKGIFHVVQQGAARWVAIDGSAMLLLCLAAGLAGAGLLHFAVEQPALRLRRRVLARQLPPAAGPPTPRLPAP